MTDFEPSHELPSEPQPRGVQFSTRSLLVVLTAASVLLAVYLGIGRAVGMTNSDIVSYGLSQFLYGVPLIIVWTVGLLLSLARRRHEWRNKNLLVVAFSGLIGTAVVIDISRMVMIFLIMQQGAPQFQWAFSLLSVFSILLNTFWWVLILVAIFRGREEASRAHNVSTETNA